MAHVYAARAVLPGMVARGEGYLLTTASAAGLLTQIGDAPYSVTKHAAVAFAEWLAITYGDEGIKVSCLCPQGVNTDMLPAGGRRHGRRRGAGPGRHRARATWPTRWSPGLAAERFLILPHPEVHEYVQRKADRPRPLARRHAQAPAPHPRRPSAMTADRAPPRPPLGRVAPSLEVGLRPGDRVRFRQREGGAWQEATVERRERDGSIGVRDERGRGPGHPARPPRGAHHRARAAATVWEPVAERAGRDEQLGLL